MVNRFGLLAVRHWNDAFGLVVMDLGPYRKPAQYRKEDDMHAVSGQLAHRDRTGRPRLVGLLPAVLAALLLIGCNDKPEQEPEPEPGAEAPAGAAPAKAEAAAPAPTLTELAAVVAAAAQTLTTAEAEVTPDEKKALGSDAKVVGTLYGKHKPAGGLWLFTPDGQLTEDGSAVATLLSEAELLRHGLSPKDYHLEGRAAAITALQAAAAAEAKALETWKDQPKVLAVAQAIASWLRGGDGGEVVLAKAGGSALTDAERRSLAAGLPALQDAAGQLRGAVVAADQQLLRAVLRYLADYQYIFRAHPLKYMTPAVQAKQIELNADKLVTQLVAGKGKLAEVCKGVWPKHPQYALLLGAYDSWAKKAAAGPWPVMPKLTTKNLKKGATGPVVLALRERLTAEGYDAGLGADSFDAELDTALKAYQTQHQLDPDGLLTKSVLAELDVPVERRRDQVALAMQRLRESEGKDANGDFLWVNIALQKLFIYEANEPAAEHKVIVGNNDVDTDQGTQVKGKINRTKMFSHKMVRIILAPKWFPTPRVVELELQPLLATNPAELEAKGYVREVQPDGTEVWYQRPGKSNLLGHVKFQGPNKFNIYLHDTPFREKFSKARRAFSHGCVRTADPLKLAERILGRDRGMSPKEIQDIIDEAEEKEIRLKSPIWVHIDYATAHVGADGEVHFGADIYGYDQAFFGNALPVEEAKEYKAASTRGL